MNWYNEGVSLKHEILAPQRVIQMLTDNEKAIIAYETTNGLAVITNKRIIMSETKGTVIHRCNFLFKSVIMHKSKIKNGHLNHIELFSHEIVLGIIIGKDVDGFKLDEIIGQNIL